VTYQYVEDDDQLILYRTGYADKHLVDEARLGPDGVWRPSTAHRMVAYGSSDNMSLVSEARAGEVAAQLGGSLDSQTVAT
jgi:hypothetical protein